MLDLTKYKSRYYEVKISENEIIHIETPKRNQLKKILSLTKNMNKEEISETDIDSLYEAAIIAFNKNKEGKKFDDEQIEEILGFDSLYAFFDGYYTWIAGNINQKN